MENNLKLWLYFWPKSQSLNLNFNLPLHNEKSTPWPDIANGIGDAAFDIGGEFGGDSGGDIGGEVGGEVSVDVADETADDVDVEAAGGFEF